MSDEDVKNQVSQAMWSYLVAEASKRGITIMEMYAIELSAQDETVTERFLEHVQGVADPPQRRGKS